MQKGDIAVFSGVGIISGTIEEVTDSIYSHTALVIDDEHIVEALGEGIVVRNISEYDGIGYAIMRQILPATEEQKDKIVETAYNFTGIKYNWLETIWIGIKRLLHLPGINPFYSKHRMNCVNLVLDSYATGGVNLFPGVDPGSIVPSDLTKNALLYMVEFHKPATA